MRSIENTSLGRYVGVNSFFTSRVYTALTMSSTEHVAQMAATGDARARRLLQQTRELAEAVCSCVGDRRFLYPLMEAGLNNRLDLQLLKQSAERCYLSRSRLAELLESYSC